MKKSIDQFTDDELKAEMKRRGFISSGFSAQDIKEYALGQMEIDLTDKQVKEVMSRLDDTDATIGVNWDTIEVAISEVTEG